MTVPYYLLIYTLLTSLLSYTWLIWLNAYILKLFTFDGLFDINY